VLVNDACFRPPITIKSHDLHGGHIREVMGEIIFYLERVWLSPFFLVVIGCSPFGLSLAILFCLPCDGFGHQFFI